MAGELRETLLRHIKPLVLSDTNTLRGYGEYRDTFMNSNVKKANKEYLYIGVGFTIPTLPKVFQSQLYQWV